MLSDEMTLPFYYWHMLIICQGIGQKSLCSDFAALLTGGGYSLIFAA